MIYSVLPNAESTPIFKNVDRQYIDKYFNSDSAYVKTLPAGEIAYSQENSDILVAFIIKGTARVYTEAREESALIRTLHSGDVFGIANLYDNEPFPSYIVTATDAEILFIDGNTFKEFIENDSTAMKNYLSFLSDKIVFLNKKIAILTAGSSERKLASYILEHQIQGVFTPASSLCELANILQMGRASLYRALDTLSEKQLIEKQGKNIIILDEEKLKNYK